MYPFLKAVAEDVYHKFGDNLSRTAIVFPGKRAGLFFNQYLVECAGHPLWAPAYITISDLFGQLSTLKVENPIRQVCLLHKIFNQHTLRNEPLDDFFYWGELMLSDFDDIDKNLVEADDLFINLADVKTINSRFEFLTEEQKNVLERFFSGFRDQQQRTALKDRFIELWRVMGTIYKELHTQLHANGMAYEGMMYRDAIEHFDSERLTFDRYIIVGFNVLNKVEQELFTKLKENGINICIDTNGGIWTPAVEELFMKTDLVLLDVKQMNPERHQSLTGRSNSQTLKTAEWLEQNQRPFWLRYVLVPGISDFKEDIRALGEHFKDYKMIQRVEILPYHTLGKHKYETMGQEYALKDTKTNTPEQIDKAKSLFDEYFTCTMVN